MKVHVNKDNKITGAFFEDLRLNPDNPFVVQSCRRGIWKDLLTEAQSEEKAREYLALFKEYTGKLPEFDFEGKDYIYVSETKIREIKKIGEEGPKKEGRIRRAPGMPDLSGLPGRPEGKGRTPGCREFPGTPGKIRENSDASVMEEKEFQKGPRKWRPPLEGVPLLARKNRKKAPGSPVKG